MNVIAFQQENILLKATLVLYNQSMQVTTTMTPLKTLLDLKMVDNTKKMTSQIVVKTKKTMC